MGLFEKLKIGLNKSSKNLSKGLDDLIFKKKIDEDALQNFEDFLIESDVGVDATKEIKDKISKEKINPDSNQLDQVKEIFSKYAYTLLKPLEKKIEDDEKKELKVIVIAGVNGVGKTTTIGKLGKILSKKEGKIVFAAADTFRAAAISQLEKWSEKVNAKLIKSDHGADPASVAFKAAEYSIKNGSKYLIIDTAGRLQNKKNLMDEFKKIINVLKKQNESFPHETILVLDATSGQNVINQVQEFIKLTKITGLIMTKLDGTAKGGILIALAKKFQIPIIAVGVGEKEDDLLFFNAKTFVDALLSD
tara:strand:- start:769 stop:1683 length:915 start_codon:yes stop_codon:yes gene_type:complete